jgi:nucleoside-diphosphate-sugar epimerase
MDGLDAESVMSAVLDARPDVVVHQLTSLKGLSSFRNLDRSFALTNRLRTEGTDHLLSAAQAAGAKRLVAQSFTGWTNPRDGGPVATEDDGFDPRPVVHSRRTLDAIAHLERVVTSADGLTGIALRYGGFYGGDSGLSKNGDMLELVRRRRFPVVGSGAGVWSLVHVEDAARATLQALDHGDAGVYNIVDDDPAPVSEWLPELAAAVGAPPPRRLPAWLARPLVGEQGVVMMTEVRGSSNAKARRELDWAPRYSSWREGFHALA